MKLGLITTKEFSCCDLFLSLQKNISAHNLEIALEKIYLEDIIIFQENTKTLLKSGDFNLLQDFDAFLFRVDIRKNLNKLHFIARTLSNNNKFIVNKTLSNYTTFSDKLSVLNVLDELNINHPKTIYIESSKALNLIPRQLDFPFVLKDPFGWQGDAIYLINSQKEFKKFKKNIPKNGFIAQEYLPISSDVRIIVIGYTALGAMERISPKNDFRSNLSVGGTAKQTSLTKELKEISQKIAQHIKSEMLGVDIFVCDNILYVNEIETCPGFDGFSKCTQSNPVLKLLQYMQKHYMDTL